MCLVISVKDKPDVANDHEVAKQEPEDQERVSLTDACNCLAQVIKCKYFRALDSQKDEGWHQCKDLKVSQPLENLDLMPIDRRWGRYEAGTLVVYVVHITLQVLPEEVSAAEQ